MQDETNGGTARLNALSEALTLVREAYVKTKDCTVAMAALVLSELALHEINLLEERKKAGKPV